ncbi:putative sulfotransferase protein [Geminocystis sp. NIES-3708]|uniref:sulfotransferase family protein n=1 Tax=Geminocystis sp. NIES-3708 TaxID=1615909 RepID=UPI0005FC4AAF|nr:sulfotransferase [Geminocystis sp. NIES-3708]BAQ61651.1 putative sulfotransferase protein [Geminocystis sp. NIES-3708]
MNTYQSATLILTGMHRSGTSLLSSLLQSAGVNIGKRLVPANDGNPKGYFENSDFVEFHENVLFSLGIDKIGWTTLENCQPPCHYIDEAKKLIERNQDPEQPWGWKEPRTTLFLDFWSNLLPNAYFIFVYRSPWEVLDSLYRRGDDIFRHNPELALQAWSSYNRQIVNFYQKYSDKSLLFNLAKVTINPNYLIEMINEKFNLSLPSVDSNIYDPSSLKTDTKKSQRPHLLKVYFPDIWEQYQELNKMTNFEEPLEEVLENLSDNAWVLQDWLNVRILEKTLKQEKKISDEHIDSVYQKLGETIGEKESFEFHLGESQRELKDSQSQLQQTHQELENTKQELYNTQSQLQQTHQELENTKQELYSTQSQLQQTHQELENTKQELYSTQSQLQQTHQELENNKFQLQESQRELQDKKYELQQQELAFKELHFYFERSQEELKQTQEKVIEIKENLQRKQEELRNSQEKIIFMESSKFWKLRNKWFRLKGEKIE